ncbi:hypothetical protein DPMN_126622 [Dreissena polymorpha]|uniref:Uncharacterized protein n=1 Tax=Dreissena polymorpha TaxID=45954 RepID=A0A9D4GWE4_DREPO|nr:hypothetical protein DPMN_126622 [Dreissena polymorpha]
MLTSSIVCATKSSLYSCLLLTDHQVLIRRQIHPKVERLTEVQAPTYHGDKHRVIGGVEVHYLPQRNVSCVELRSELDKMSLKTGLCLE